MSKSKNASKNGTPKAKGTLTKPQVRILQALAKASGPINRATTAKRAGIAESWITGFVARACKANTTPSLSEQGYAKVVELDIDGKAEIAYVVTANGRKALAKELAK